MFDFDIDEEVTQGSDMILVNGRIPEEKIGASIILITCSRKEEGKLGEFIKREDGMVFVFEDGITSPAELLNAFSGYGDYSCITEEEYEKLKGCF